MKKVILGIGVFALLLGIAGATAGTVLAYRGDATVKGPNYTTERHEAMTAAFANQDYAAWKALMPGRGRAAELINETNFAKFAEAHNLQLQGKTAEAKQLRQELGLGLRNSNGNGNRNGEGAGRMGGGCQR